MICDNNYINEEDKNSSLNINIGILTLSASDNCGSLLQAYALQESVKRIIGVNVEIINFRSYKSRIVYSIFPISAIRNSKILIWSLKNIHKLVTQKKDYKMFRKSYLNMSKTVYTSASSMKYPYFNYDIVVVGSDQVWNIRMADFDNAFFLPKIKYIKKIAYAPSLGNTSINVSGNNNKLIANWIQDFANISVREEEGQKNLEKIFGSPVPLLADPTLIIDAKLWYQLTETRLVNEDYIFYYSWSYSDDKLNNIVKNIAMNNNLHVYVINASKWGMNKPIDYGFILYDQSGPMIFLNLMRYATKVFVESYHGMIFAYIFKKDFWLVDTHVDFVKMNPRLISLLDLLDMNNRVLTSENYHLIDWSQRPNYDKSNHKLDEIIEKSLEYIKNLIKI